MCNGWGGRYFVGVQRRAASARSEAEWDAKIAARDAKILKYAEKAKNFAVAKWKGVQADSGKENVLWGELVSTTCTPSEFGST